MWFRIWRNITQVVEHYTGVAMLGQQDGDQKALQVLLLAEADASSSRLNRFMAMSKSPPTTLTPHTFL